MPKITLVKPKELGKIGSLPVKAMIVPGTEELRISRKTTPEEVAHEFGHYILKSVDDAHWNWKEYIQNELNAWFWVGCKRGKVPRTDFIWRVLCGACENYPETAPTEIFRETEGWLKGTNYELTPERRKYYFNLLMEHYGERENEARS